MATAYYGEEPKSTSAMDFTEKLRINLLFPDVQKMGEAILKWWNEEKPTPLPDIPAEVAQLVRRCHNHSTIFTLDSLDAALSSSPPSYRLESLVEETRLPLIATVPDIG